MSFTLLTLPEVSLRSEGLSETGLLAVECVSDTSPPPNAKESGSALTLGFRLGSHYLKLPPSSPIKLVISRNGQRAYSFESAGEKTGEVQLVIPPPTEDAPHIAQDIETFDHLLTQYTELSWTFDSPDLRSTPPPLPARSGHTTQPDGHVHQTNIKTNVEQAQPVEDPDLRGHLVLMDESNGDIVGELPGSLHLTEDPSLPKDTNGSDAVVLEMQPAMYDAYTGATKAGMVGDELRNAREVIVRAVPPEEQDLLMKSATVISQMITSSTSLLLAGIESASNYYIAHSAPGTPKNNTSGNTSPSLPNSSTTNSSALARAHAVSGQARMVTQRTADAVGDMIARAMGGKPKAAASTSAPASTSTTPPPDGSSPQGPPPPYAVYKPKRRPQAPSRVQSEKGTCPGSEAVDNTPKGPPGFKDKLLMSANLLLTTVDDSARRVFEVGTDRLGAVVGHKYGPEAQQSTHLASHTARNVVLVYVDMRGFARRALLQKAGTEFVKARVAANKEQAGAADGTLKS